MLQRKRAWDIMREEFFSVEEDASLSQVVKQINLSREKYPDNTFVLVFSKKSEFLGVITMWNILQAMGPCLLKGLDQRGESNWDQIFHVACQTCSQVGIRETIQRDVPAIKPTDPLAKIMEIFLDYRRGRAVVEEGGKIIGVVLLADVYREIAKDVENW